MRAQRTGARTYLAEEKDHAAIATLDAALSGAPDGAAVVSPRPGLMTFDGTQLELPPSVVEALAQVAAAMARHKLVTIVPGEQLLTTQQAADRLAISRPTLIQLLADGQIPYEYRGHHRRVALAEILAYEQRKPRRHPGRLNVRAGR